MRPALLADAAALAARIPDGALLALAPDYAGAPIAVVKELVRRGARGLRLLGVPQLGLPAELLIAGGCVAEVETAAIGLGELGTAPAFERARRAGRVRVRESSCPAIHSALQAAEKGLPFLPVRGILGSDLLALRPDWKVVDNPFPPHDPILLVPAIRPDLALVHAPLADREGNVWIGVRRELMLMAHAARGTLVSVERLRQEPLLADPLYAPGTIPALYLDTIALVPGGARPTALWGETPELEALEGYARAAASEGGLARWLEAWLAGMSAPASRRELLIAVISELLAGCRHVAVGAASPIPAAGALLARARDPGLAVSLLGSAAHNAFTDGGKELFDCAAQGRIDAFFLSGAQIDGRGNVNLLGLRGADGRLERRFQGCFGAPYLAFLVPRLILFREEHTPATLVERVDFVSAPGTSPPGVHRPGGPAFLLTGRCLFRFEGGGFRLERLHPGETLEGVRAATSFGFALARPPGRTAEPDAATLALIRGPVARALADAYPRFATRLSG